MITSKNVLLNTSMKFGSQAHKKLFCQQFIDTYLEYEPESLPFPNLDREQLTLLKGIPFWEIARDTEREAGILVSAYAEIIEDTVIRDAIALQGKEEGRHARLIQTLIERYDIPVGEPSSIALPNNIEKAFTTFGFEECLDSFFAFGLFGIAREAGIFPEQLFTIFDPILDEEARHIVFFVNWFTYMHPFAPLRATKTLWYYGRALRNVVAAFGNNDNAPAGFTAKNANAFSLDNITPKEFLNFCLQENNKRMSKFDPRLLQPKLLPRLCSVAWQVLQFLPKQTEKNQSYEL
jgi:hypothetical protein